MNQVRHSPEDVIRFGKELHGVFRDYIAFLHLGDPANALLQPLEAALRLC